MAKEESSIVPVVVEERPPQQPAVGLLAFLARVHSQSRSHMPQSHGMSEHAHIWHQNTAWYLGVQSDAGVIDF